MATTVTLISAVPANLADSLGLAAGDRQPGDVLVLPHRDALALLRAGVASFGSAAGDAVLPPTVPPPQLVIARSPAAWHASADGGRVAYNITTGIVPLAATGAEQLLGAFQNPAGSGRDIFIDMGEFGCSLNGTFRRYRNAALSGLSAPISASNMGGGPEPSVGRMYVGGTAPTFTRTGGVVAKTAHIAAFQQYLTSIGGRVVLRPGNTLVWTITGPTGNTNNFTASVYFEYWELPAA